MVLRCIILLIIYYVIEIGHEQYVNRWGCTNCEACEASFFKNYITHFKIMCLCLCCYSSIIISKGGKLFLLWNYVQSISYHRDQRRSVLTSVVSWSQYIQYCQPYFTIWTCSSSVLCMNQHQSNFCYFNPATWRHLAFDEYVHKQPRRFCYRQVHSTRLVNYNFSVRDLSILLLYSLGDPSSVEASSTEQLILTE